jgi:subtilisin family serine protease
VESGIHQAHSNGVTGEGVLVGVLDTGCDADHIQFRQKGIDFRYVPPYSGSDSLRAVRGFDVDGHGTHVCGVIAGQHIGVAPGADLMVASVIESDTYQTSLSRISIALDWMLSQFGTEENSSKPIIVNMSLGFAPEHISKNDRATLMVGIQELISTLVEDFDVLPIVAIGNDGPGKMRAPGYFPETLSVGAVDFNREPAGFSGGGLSPTGERTQPDIAGYGVNIFSSLERDKNNRSLYKHISGTSMATPYVAGIAALYASMDAKLQGRVLRQHLLSTALPLQASADRVGAGLARFTENGNKMHRTAPVHSIPPSNMLQFMVRVNRPSSKELAGVDRAEKYKLLKANSVKRKDEIKAWIKAKGLAGEVFKIEEPTVFNMLFITCTPKVAEQLEHADAVVSISRSPEFSVGLAKP